jgi:4-coumarate--CoA ligase
MSVIISGAAEGTDASPAAAPAERSPALCFDLPAEAVLRMLRPLLAQEIAAATGRRIDPAEAEAWPDDVALGEEGLGLDSLGVMACAAAVDRLFQLHETGAEGYLLLDRRLSAWAEIVRAALRHGVSGFTFATSGSTGAPRLVSHPLRALLEEARFWAATFADRRRVVLGVPAHHIYGCLFGVLLPEAVGVPVLSRRAATPAALARDLVAGDLLVGFPAGHALLAATGARLPADLAATSSTALLPRETAIALRGAGVARLVEIYGSSETAGIGWRDSPDAPFRLLPRWRPGGAGEASSLIEAATGAEIALPDRVAWQPGGLLTPTGRKDNAVQVAGTNVWPARVAAEIAAHPDVAEAAVRLDTGLPVPRLKAFVVPRPGANGACLEAALAAWCASRLSPPERPVRFDLGPALPRNDMGKAADWEMAARAA